MSGLSLQERLIRYLKNNPNKRIAKERLCEMAKAKMGVTGETVGRRLRVFAEVSLWGYRPTDTPEHQRAEELLEGGRVYVKKEGEKHHAVYWYVPPSTKIVREVKIVDGVAKEIFREVTNET